jgi:hypothetical protein
MASVQIINPEVPNYAQWDWNPGSVAVAAAGAGQKMMSGVSQERREQEEFELEKLLFPTKKKYNELQLAKIQSEINENNANAERLKGMYDSKFLMGSGVSGSFVNERYGDLLKSSRLFGDSAQPVTQTPQGNSFSLDSDTSFF